MCSPKHVPVPLDKVARFLPPCRWLTGKQRESLNPPRAELIMPVCVSVRAGAGAGGQAGGPSSSSVSPSTSVSAGRTTERERRQRRHARHFLHLSSRENALFLEAWRGAAEIRARKWDIPHTFEKHGFSGAAAAPLNHSGGTPPPRDGSGGRADARARAPVVHMCSWRRPPRPPARRSAPCLCLSCSLPLQPSVPDRRFRNEAVQRATTCCRPVTLRNPVTMDMAAMLVPADSHSD